MTKIVVDLSSLNKEICVLIDIGWMSSHELIDLLRLISLALQTRSRITESLTAVETIIKASFKERSSEDLIDYSSNCAIVIQNVIVIAKHLIVEYDKAGMYSTNGLCEYVLESFDYAKLIGVFTRIGVKTK